MPAWHTANTGYSVTSIQLHIQSQGAGGQFDKPKTMFDTVHLGHVAERISEPRELVVASLSVRDRERQAVDRPHRTVMDGLEAARAPAAPPRQNNRGEQSISDQNIKMNPIDQAIVRCACSDTVGL